MRKLLNILLIALFLLTSCTSNTVNTTANNEGYVPITIAVMSALDSIPVFIAEEKGFFEAEGINVTLERFTSGADRDAAFTASTDMDGILIDAVALAMYMEGGIDMVSISSTIGHAYIIGNQGVYTPEDLYGRTVLIAFNTAMDYILHSALREVRISSYDIQTQSVPSLPTRMELLLNGQADAAVLPEPLATVAREAGLNTIATTYQLGINPFMLAFRRSSAEEKTAELQAVLRGLNNAVDFLNTFDSPREEGLIDLIVDIVGFPDHVRNMTELPEFPHFKPPLYFHIDDVFDFARDRNLLTSELSAQDVIFDPFNTSPIS
ncbi:MAG: ABC transporter substrate-binding protein [Defluviitaleaceae bacterium]|nr:ABC transporter substrate-binding protein [Defluviitaleaceae bacterium]